jgi:hypothetical protein
MKQLAAARAVITIWTENSIKSDWVRAEAGRAKAEAKLIPVKTPDVAYADIPLPFGEMHTENIGSTELIRAAVVAQLAKPAVVPSATALLAKGFKYEVLTWFGIVGGALTLFTNLSAVLKLAEWARVLVQHWKEWTHAFWVWVFGWLGIHLKPEWTPVLSFLLFWSLLTIGQAVTFNRKIKTQTIANEYEGKSFQLTSWRTRFMLSYHATPCKLVDKASIYGFGRSRPFILHVAPPRRTWGCGDILAFDISIGYDFATAGNSADVCQIQIICSRCDFSYGNILDYHYIHSTFVDSFQNT